MFDINLVPEIQQQKQTLAKKNTYATIFGIAVVGTVVAALVVMGSIKVGASISLSNTNDKIASTRAESEQYRELEENVLSLESGLNGIKGTLDGRNSWTLLLPHLEKATPKDVQFVTLAIEGTSLTATLKGKDVNSIARFIESYKNYQVIVLTGSGTPQEDINISSGGNSLGTTRVKSNGTWIYATRLDLTANREISVIGETTNVKASYFADTHEIKTTEGSMNARVANLFNSVETKQYSKEGSTANFDTTITVFTEALW